VRPLLLLFVGTRGGRVADACASLASVADVVLVTSRDLLAQRADTVDVSVGAREVLVAEDRAGIPAVARAFASEHAVGGALTFSDDVVDLTAAFAAEQGLPGQPVGTVVRFRDKVAQRRALAEGGVPVPPFALVTSPDDGDRAGRAVTFPAILKPTRGSGGALAYVVESRDALTAALDDVFAQAPAAGGAVEKGTAFILESLLRGEPRQDVAGLAPYVSVESVAHEGRYTHLAVTDRFPVAPPVLETGMMLPSCLPAARQDEVVDMATRALHALGLRTGLAHTELMLTADGPRVIEVNARAGGALPYLFPMCSDVDLAAQAGRVALGLPPVERARFHGHAVFVGPQHPVGVRVRGVHGLDEVSAMPGVRAVIPLASAGTCTDGFRDTLVAAVLASVEGPEDAVGLWRDVMRTVRGDYEPSAAQEVHS